MLEKMRSGPLRSKASSALTCAQPPFGADQTVRAQLHLVEKDLREVCVASEVPDGPHAHAGQGEVDDELRQASLSVLLVPGRAHQGNHVLAVLRVGGPDLLAVEQPASAMRARAGCHARQIGAGIGLAHADAEKACARQMRGR